MTAIPRHRTPLGRLTSTLLGGAMGALLLAPFGLAQAEDDTVRFGTPQWPLSGRCGDGGRHLENPRPAHDPAHRVLRFPPIV